MKINEKIRFYRDYGGELEGASFKAQIETTDLYIRAARNLEKEATEAIKEAREELESYISGHPRFASSLEPLETDEGAPPIVRSMLTAGKLAGTGPMAAVAGAVAAHVGRALKERSPWAIVENGGDIYIDVGKLTTVGLWAGNSPFSGKIGLKVDSTARPVGVCTSSGTVGPSLSFGKADAVTAISHDVELADAVATAMGNRVTSPSHLEEAVEWAVSIKGIFGALAIMGDRLACRGEIELAKIA